MADVKKDKAIHGLGLFMEHEYMCRIKTITYTGDGTVAQVITVAGFTTIVFVKIFVHPETGGSPPEERNMYEKHTSMSAVVAHQHSGIHTVNVPDRIIDLTDNTFTVDDDGVDDHPNKLAQVYDAVVFGY